jgi:hypothetical protein
MNEQQDKKVKDQYLRSHLIYIDLFYLLKLMKKIYLVLAIIFLIIITFVGTFLMFDQINSATNPSKTWFTWFVIVCSAPLLLYLNQFRAATEGLHLVAKKNRIEALLMFISFFLQIMFLIKGMGLTFNIVCYLFSLISAGLINWYLVMSHPKVINAEKKTNSPSHHIKKIFLLSYKSGVGTFIQLAFQYGLTIFIGNTYDAKNSSVILTIFRFFTGVSRLSGAFFYAKIPLLNYYFMIKDYKAFKKITINNIFLSQFFFLVGSAIVIFYLFNYTFIPVDVSVYFISVLVLALFIERLGALMIQAYSSTNNIIWYKANGLLVLSSLLFLILFKDNYGVQVIAYSLLFGNTIYCIYTFHHFKKLLSLKDQ